MTLGRPILDTSRQYDNRGIVVGLEDLLVFDFQTWEMRGARGQSQRGWSLKLHLVGGAGRDGVTAFAAWRARNGLLTAPARVLYGVTTDKLLLPLGFR